tara:strand:- start:722 stop:1852 length:1131 start_codon:yes stop_codon:yes gene_type:complete
MKVINMKKIIAVISFSDLENDSRVKRQIDLISNNFNVITIGFGSYRRSLDHLQINNKNCFFKKLFFLFLIITRRYKTYFKIRFEFKKIIEFINKYKVSCYILNDSNSWPFAEYLQNKKYIIDAHEYSLDELSDNNLWRLIFKPLKKWSAQYIINSHARFSVEKNICAKWEKATKKEFILLRNCSSYSQIRITNNKNKIFKIIHHGIAEPSRKIENMIHAIGECGKSYKGTFYLKSNNKEYLNYIIKISKKNNVEILEPINENLLINEGNKFDIGIMSIYPSNLNYKYCLPNKLFQFIQSRIPIISGPTPSIKKIIEKYDIGKVAKSFEIHDISETIKTLTKYDIKRMKINCDLAAKELCWEKEGMVLIKEIEKMME